MNKNSKALLEREGLTIQDVLAKLAPCVGRVRLRQEVARALLMRQAEEPATDGR